MAGSGKAEAEPVEEILTSFLKATTEAESTQLLGELISEHILPLAEEIVRANLRGNALQDADDITAEVALQLIRKLKDLRSNPDRQILDSFRGYIAVTTYNTCYQYLRSEYPARARLKDKLRYLVTTDRGFAFWEGKNRQWVCGFASWRQERSHQTCARGRLRELHEDPHASIDIRRIREQAQRLKPRQLLTLVFGWAGKPVVLDDLVDTVAHLLQVTDWRPESEAPARSAAIAPDTTATKLEQRLYLQQLWAEILALPLEQRHALLLSARDDISTLLANARIATLREIADALEMPSEEYAHQWNGPPQSDAAIASRLGITRQRIINLRHAARKRLARRMKKFDGERQK